MPSIRMSLSLRYNLDILLKYYTLFFIHFIQAKSIFQFKIFNIYLTFETLITYIIIVNVRVYSGYVNVATKFWASSYEIVPILCVLLKKLGLLIGFFLAGRYLPKHIWVKFDHSFG